MKKKLLRCLLTLCMLSTIIAVLPITANAATSGQCGDNVYWTLDDNGTLTISGTGAMYDYDLGAGCDNYPYWYQRTDVDKVIINDGVSSIGKAAFNCCSLTSIAIPDSVTFIGKGAFWGCSYLQTVNLPDDLSTIEPETFSNCTSLKNITIPNNVTKIRYHAFLNCKSMTSITIGNRVNMIGDGVFNYCESLSTVVYIGGQTSWNKISIDRLDNTYFLQATKVFRTCGTDVGWNLEDDGTTLIITGNGNMSNYTESSIPWYYSRYNIKKNCYR